MAKVTIAKDWFKTKQTKRIQIPAVQIHTFERAPVKHLEDLPELLTIEEASKVLRCHEKTLRKWIANNEIRSIKIKGRRYVTPEQISEFLNRQYRKNG